MTTQRISTNSSVLLEVVDLVAAYGSHIVLSDIYCHFLENTITAIVGPSGCGKSTFVKTLNRTLELIPGGEVLSGEVYLGGVGIYSGKTDAMAIRKRIGIIHQNPLPFPMSTVENVLFGARFHRHLDGMSPREYAEFYLEKVGLLDEIKDRLDDSAYKLSGGQQQRLCLARTLANHPEIILMDEPCSAIDPAATRRIEELCLELQEEYTIVIVTHNMAQARRISEHTILMFGGHIIEAGTTEQIFSKPKTELARDFVGGVIG